MNTGRLVNIPGLVNAVEGVDVRTLHEDFMGATVASSDITCAGWTNTDDSGAVNTDFAYAVADNGIQIVGKAGTNKQGGYLSTTNKVVTPSSSNIVGFKMRVKRTDANDYGVAFGLGDIGTDCPFSGDSLASASDCACLHAAQADSFAMQYHTRDQSNTSETDAALGASMTTTFKWFEIVIEHASTVKFYVNNECLKEVTTDDKIPTGTGMEPFVVFEGDGTNTGGIEFTDIFIYETL